MYGLQLGFFPMGCPKCDNDEFEYGDISNHGESGLKQEITCNECESIFIEYFIATHWEIKA